MFNTKETLRDDPAVTNQQAIVDRLAKKKKSVTKKTIPAGKTMMDTLDKKLLTTGFNNWLRMVRNFEEVSFNLAKTPEKYSLKKEKIADFPKNREPIWRTHPDRRKYLAELMADALMSHKLVKLEVNADGMYVYQDVNDSFGPTRLASDDDVSETVAKGDKVPSEDWEPNIVFTHKSR